MEPNTVPAPTDVDQYKDMKCSECGAFCKFQCLAAHIHKFACHTETCLLRTESVHVDPVEGVFYPWKSAPSRDPEFDAAPYGTRQPPPAAEEDPDLGPPRDRSRKTRNQSPPPEKKSRRSKPAAADTDDTLIRCSVCGNSCELRCLKSHIAKFSCHTRGCFLHDQSVEVDVEGGVMYLWKKAKSKPQRKHEPEPAPYGAGGTHYQSPYDDYGPGYGTKSPYDAPPSFYDTRPPAYDRRGRSYNVREVSPTRDQKHTKYRTDPDRGREPRGRSRPRDTGRRPPSPSPDRGPRDPDGRDRERASTFPTKPTKSDPFNHPFFKRERTTREPPLDRGRKRGDSFSSYIDRSMDEMDRMMAGMGVGFGGGPPRAPPLGRSFASGFMRGPPPPPPRTADPYPPSYPTPFGRTAPGPSYAPRPNPPPPPPRDADPYQTTSYGYGPVPGPRRTRPEEEPVFYEYAPAEDFGGGYYPKRGGRSKSRTRR